MNKEQLRLLVKTNLMISFYLILIIVLLLLVISSTMGMFFVPLIVWLIFIVRPFLKDLKEINEKFERK